jgi:hypothetical protein
MTSSPQTCEEAHALARAYPMHFTLYLSDPEEETVHVHAH